MWYVTSQKNGASALGLKKVLGLRQLPDRRGRGCIKLRRAMVRPGLGAVFVGLVEVDET